MLSTPNLRDPETLVHRVISIGQEPFIEREILCTEGRLGEVVGVPLERYGQDVRELAHYPLIGARRWRITKERPFRPTDALPMVEETTAWLAKATEGKMPDLPFARYKNAFEALEAVKATIKFYEESVPAGLGDLIGKLLANSLDRNIREAYLHGGPSRNGDTHMQALARAFGRRAAVEDKPVAVTVMELNLCPDCLRHGRLHLVLDDLPSLRVTWEGKEHLFVKGKGLVDGALEEEDPD